jgi:hypothetical protein
LLSLFSDSFSRASLFLKLILIIKYCNLRKKDR